MLHGSGSGGVDLRRCARQADHHLVRIAEVFAGGDAPPLENVEYVQLQMTSSGQNFFGGTNSTVTLFGEDGAVTATQPLPGNPANGQRGRRVLLGAQDMAPLFPGPDDDPDFEWSPDNYLSLTGGAACFTSGVFGPIDCVSWGAYDGTPAPPSPTGGNAPALASGVALIRRTSPCSGGLIDTNNPGDLTPGPQPPDPQNNAAPAATGVPANTTITKKPRKRATSVGAVRLHLVAQPLHFPVQARQGAVQELRLAIHEGRQAR